MSWGKVSAFLAALVLLVSFFSSATQAQTTLPMLYRAKFICGKGDGKILGLGSYLTAINVHNPSDSKADPDAKPISLEMKVAVALPGGGGKFSGFSGLIDLK